MAGEYLSIRVKQDTIEAVRNLNKRVPNCLGQALDLGAWVDKGVIYQKVGNDYLQVSIRDFDPLPKPSVGDKLVDFINIQLDSEVYSGIIHKVGTFAEWMSRAVALRLRAEELHLFHFNGEGYQNINFCPEPQEGS